MQNKVTIQMIKDLLIKNYKDEYKEIIDFIERHTEAQNTILISEIQNGAKIKLTAKETITFDKAIVSKLYKEEKEGGEMFSEKQIQQIATIVGTILDEKLDKKLDEKLRPIKEDLKTLKSAHPELF